MIGLDTNVLVRYIVQDDVSQSAKASSIIEQQCTVQNPGRVDSIVLCECIWVLESAYGYSRSIIASVIEQLLSTAELQIESAEAAWQALRAYQSTGADYADYFVGIRNHSEGCDTTYTFDKKAAKSQWHSHITSI